MARLRQAPSATPSSSDSSAHIPKEDISLFFEALPRLATKEDRIQAIVLKLREVLRGDQHSCDAIANLWAELHLHKAFGELETLTTDFPTCARRLVDCDELNNYWDGRAYAEDIRRTWGIPPRLILSAQFIPPRLSKGLLESLTSLARVY